MEKFCSRDWNNVAPLIFLKVCDCYKCVFFSFVLLCLLFAPENKTLPSQTRSVQESGKRQMSPHKHTNTPTKPMLKMDRTMNRSASKKEPKRLDHEHRHQTHSNTKTFKLGKLFSKNTIQSFYLCSCSLSCWCFTCARSFRSVESLCVCVFVLFFLCFTLNNFCALHRSLFASFAPAKN